MSEGEEPGHVPVQVSLNPRLRQRGGRAIWVAIAILAVVWLAYLVREIWLPLAIAFLIAMVLDPVVDRMERRGWSRLAASSLIFAGFILSFGAALFFAVPPIVSQARSISEQVGQYIPAPGDHNKAERSLAKMLDRTRAPVFVRAAVTRGATQLSRTLINSTNWLAEHAMQVLSNLIWIVIIPIVTFYALKDFHLILAKTLLLVPSEKRPFAQTMMSEVTAIFARFLRGLMIVAALNGLATWALLFVLGMPNAFTLGAIAGLLYTIPYLGAAITIVLVAGIALLHSGPMYMLAVVGANLLLHQVIFDQVVTPRILGKHVGLHPILSIMALLAGNVLLGIIGMLLAVPIAASIQLVVITMVPKLRQEIDIPAADNVSNMSRESSDEHVASDATADLHDSVTQAVEAIEAKSEEESRKAA